VEEIDERPSDGDLYVKATLQIIRGSGATRPSLNIVKAFGGLRPPGVTPVVRGPLRYDSLKVGERYWFVFSSTHQYDEYPQGVINWWPEESPAVSATLQQAVDEDRYQWRPQYEPKTGVSYGYKEEPAKRQWHIRVEKAGELLWEKVLPGTKSDQYVAWYLWPGGYVPYLDEADLTGVNGILRAETRTVLLEDNEFDLSPDEYYVAYCFDVDTGNTVTVRVAAFQPGCVERLLRRLDLETGKTCMERRQQWLDSGGIDVGAETEGWLRRVVRKYDVATGQMTSEDVFRIDGSTPVKIEADK
jgi:hypothetical protein